MLHVIRPGLSCVQEAVVVRVAADVDQRCATVVAHEDVVHGVGSRVLHSVGVDHRIAAVDDGGAGALVDLQARRQYVHKGGGVISHLCAQRISSFGGSGVGGVCVQGCRAAENPYLVEIELAVIVGVAADVDRRCAFVVAHRDVAEGDIADVRDGVGVGHRAARRHLCGAGRLLHQDAGPDHIHRLGIVIPHGGNAGQGLAAVVRRRPLHSHDVRGVGVDGHAASVRPRLIHVQQIVVVRIPTLIHQRRAFVVAGADVRQRRVARVRHGVGIDHRLARIQHGGIGRLHDLDARRHHVHVGGVLVADRANTRQGLTSGVRGLAAGCHGVGGVDADRCGAGIAPYLARVQQAVVVRVAAGVRSGDG